MFVLDTNHVSELTYRTAAGLRLLQRLDTVEQDAAVTAITVEESLRGWLAENPTAAPRTPPSPPHKEWRPYCRPLRHINRQPGPT